MIESRQSRCLALLATFAGCAVLVAAGCAGETRDDAHARHEVRVSAATSLTDAFAEIATAFEASRPGLHVALNLAGSSALREQVLAGAPVDVFAPADAENMQHVVDARLVAGAPRVFARNRLQIAVPAGNPAAIAGPADLADDDHLIGLCAAGVPCGDYARAALAAAGVTAATDTFELNVRALLTKIEAGELDAGIVYATDVASSDGVRGIDLPAAGDARPAYPIAALTEAANPEGAAAFVAFVLSDDGQRILRRHGFGAP